MPLHLPMFLSQIAPFWRATTASPLELSPITAADDMEPVTPQMELPPTVLANTPGPTPWLSTLMPRPPEPLLDNETSSPLPMPLYLMLTAVEVDAGLESARSSTLPLVSLWSSLSGAVTGPQVAAPAASIACIQVLPLQVSVTRCW